VAYPLALNFHGLGVLVLMKVVMLDPANFTPYYNYALCAGLKHIGVRINLYTSKFINDENLDPGIDVGFVDFYFRCCRRLQMIRMLGLRPLIRSTLYPLGHYKLLKELKRNKPDIVHFQWSRLPLFDALLIKALVRLNIKCVLTVHDVTTLWKGIEHHRKNIYRIVDALIVHDASSRDQLHAKFPSVDIEKVHQIEHGPLQAEFSPPHASVESAREALGLPMTRKIILFFGEIRPNKGLDNLINAYAQVSKLDDQALLMIVGKPEYNIQAKLIAMDRAGLPYEAHLEYVPNIRVWQYYLAADIVVLPYNQISQSGVLFSAIAHGKPVLVTSVGGMPEVVQQLKAGWIVPPEDPCALASALIDALKNVTLLREIGLRAKVSLEKVYDWTKISEKTLTLYQSLLCKD